MLLSVASIHLRQSDLTTFSAITLNYFGQLLPLEVLLQHCDNRFNASIIVLTLNKLLQEPAPDEAQRAKCFSQLQQELNLFNQQPSPLPIAALHQLLNLATHPDLKHLLAQWIDKQPAEAPIHSKLNELFTSFRKTQSLVPNGFLRDWLIDVV